MDSWKRFNEISLPDNEDFCSHLNMKKNTNADYQHFKIVLKNFEMKDLGYYHDLYARGDTLLLADVFGSFSKQCIEIYEFDPAHVLSAPELAWKACFKMTEVELELLTNIDMLLMVKKGIRGGISCNTVVWNTKQQIYEKL